MRLADARPSGRRVALVIGNATYPASPLRNAVNDATAMAQALNGLRFDVVKLAIDTTAVTLDRTITQFVQVLQSGDVVVVYYAGHGMQIAGENYLLPVDFQAQDEAEARYRSYSAALLHDKLAERGARMKIIILDACRNNPFRMSRAVGGGLAPMATVGRGSFIAFAAGPNSTADDNPRGKNGLFTTYLLEALAEPGLTLEQVFSRVRLRVDEASNGRQTPWTNSSVIGDFYFHPVASAAVARVGPSAVGYVNARGVLAAAGRSIPDPSATAATQAATNDLMAAVKAAAPRLGVAAVFAADSAGILWADRTLDITEDIGKAMKGNPPQPRNIGPFVRAAWINLQAIADKSRLGRAFHERVNTAPAASQAALRKQLEQEFRDALLPVLARTARAAAADVVFTSADSGLAWAEDAIDLTSAVVSALDAAGAGAAAAEAAGARSGSASDARVAVIDVQRLATATVLGKVFTARVQQLYRDKQTSIAAVPAAEKPKATEAAQKEVDELQKSLQAEFQTALSPVLETRARSAGLRLVFDASVGVAWFDPALDLTDALIRDLDAAIALRKKTP